MIQADRSPLVGLIPPHLPDLESCVYQAACMLIDQDIRISDIQNQKSFHTAWFSQCNKPLFHTFRSIVLTQPLWLKLEPKTQVFLRHAFLLRILTILFLGQSTAVPAATQPFPKPNVKILCGIRLSLSIQSPKGVSPSEHLETWNGLCTIHDKTRQHIKKQRHHFTNKGACSQSCGFQ